MFNDFTIIILQCVIIIIKIVLFRVSVWDEKWQHQIRSNHRCYSNCEHSRLGEFPSNDLTIFFFQIFYNLIIDLMLFDYCIQYFRTINTRVSVVYIETWQGANQALIDKNKEISTALLNFNEYSAKSLFNIGKDTAQLLTWVWNRSMCT